MSSQGQISYLKNIAIVAGSFILIIFHFPGYSQVNTEDLTNQELYEEIQSALSRSNYIKAAELYRTLAENDLISIANSDRAIRNYIFSIDNYLLARDTNSMYLVKMDLARLYEGSGYYKQAISSFEEALHYYESKRDTLMQARVLNQIGDVHLAVNDMDKAVLYLDSARSFNLKVQDTLLASVNNMMLAMITGQRETNVEIPDSLYEKIIQKDSVQNGNYLVDVLMNVGRFNMFNDKFPLALYYLDQAEEAAQLNRVKLKDVYREKSNIYLNVGNFQYAHYYLSKYADIKDSLFQESRNVLYRQILESENDRQKLAEIKELEKEAKITEFKGRLQSVVSYALIFGAIVMLVVTYLTIRNYQTRLNTNQIIGKQKEEITKRKIMDLENNLKIETMHSMITGQEAERERIAKDLHDSLGGLLSTVKLHFDAIQTKEPEITGLKEYTKANYLLDEACKEVRSISNNMQPGALLNLGIVPALNDLINRIQSDETPQIDFQHYGLNGSLQSHVTLNIYRIIQELLNNSIKHAKSEEILVQLIKKEDEIIIMVEDDGVGYDNSSVEKGMGTENISSRVNYLKGDLSVHSVKGTGTTTLVNIPV